MVTGLWGRKIGMTQVFVDDRVIPVTVIDLAHWFVTNIRTKERDGYDAVQVSQVRKRYVGQPFSKEWLNKQKKFFVFIREVPLKEAMSELTIGQSVDFYTLLEQGAKVDVFGKTKGCGFAGVVRRHNFSGGPGSHGSSMGKRPGSIGGMAACGKVIKGKKMPGLMGNQQRVMKNLKIVKIEKDAKILLLKGSVPGKTGSLVFVRRINKQ